MSRKALQVQIELEVHAVTCPGVWLCPNGKVTLQLYMLDSCIQTSSLPPIFPLLFHEKFIFGKTFHAAHTLADLQKYIDRDHFYVELVQWQNEEDGNVIATFQTTLKETLYPSSYEGAITGVDINLLMEPTKNFPGIIAPKIEVSTKTTVEEIICQNNKKCKSFVTNPKTISSNYCSYEPKHNQLHQQKVCHTVSYHRSRKCTKKSKKPFRNKEPFVIRHVDDNLISRRPEAFENKSKTDCKCCICVESVDKLLKVRKANISPRAHLDTKVAREYAHQAPQSTQSGEKKFPKKQTCYCTNVHLHYSENCPLCAKYKNYFDKYFCSCETTPKIERGRSKFAICTSKNESTARTRRSPTRSLERRRHCQTQTSRSCTCSPGRIRETCWEQCDNKRCTCADSKRPSLAKQLHNRLLQTLDCIPCTTKESGSRNSETVSVCSCPKFRECSDGFCENLEKFYRDLRQC